MKILLINTNPVVSRLTALSARKEGVELDEVRDVSEIDNIDIYDIIFVDSDMDIEQISHFLKSSKAKRRVIFATQEQRNIDDIFNFTILKPFLPSEVSSILRDTKGEMEVHGDSLILDKRESQKPKPKDDKREEEEYINLSRLISTKDDEIEDRASKEPNKLGEIPLFEIDNDLKESSSSSSVLEKELFSIDRDSERDVKFDEPEIKRDIVDIDPKEKIEDEPKIGRERVVNKSIEDMSVDVDTQYKSRLLKDSVSSLTIEELRKLLRGTTINIKIEFPKEV